ncbi:Serine acetyltransferase [Candidatus Hodgkinia cicadicola]|uniref:Serine acetyltransferase n=1 Tax=Candidatus Hodgkinia cicadicola TaxID=573658 RepID=A0ABX4MGH2_9HYPH|nr:Serine acetyltransferase [Candidatus Hodgkinia cicadicola]
MLSLQLDKLNTFIVARLFAELTTIDLSINYNDLSHKNDSKFVLLSLLYKTVGLRFKITKKTLDNIVDNSILCLIIDDLLANFKRDPSCKSFSECLFKPGFKVVLLYRLSLLFNANKHKVLMYINKRYRVEIGLGAVFGKRLVLDHTHGIVIGQQVEIGNDITIMHGVTLGAIGNQLGLERRHPRIQSGSSIGTNSIVLGKIEIGHCVVIGANAVVTKKALPYNVLMGIPAQAQLN